MAATRAASRSTRLPTLLATALLAACGGGGGGEAPPVLTRLEISPQGVLLAAGGRPATLTALAFDRQGRAMAAPVTWSSSRPDVAAVSAAGVVTRTGGSGAAQIVAESGGVRSTPVLAVAATPAAGAVLIDDAQLVAGPQEVDPGEAFDVGWRYRVTLAGLAGPPAPGTLLLATGEAPVAGRVVSAAAVAGGVEVVLEIVPIPQLFDELVVQETVQLRGAALPTEAALEAFHAAPLPGGGWRLEPRLLALAAPAPAGGGFAIGPFTCTTGLEWPLGGVEPRDLSVDSDVAYVIDYVRRSSEGTLFRELTATGVLTLDFTVAVRLAFSGEGKVTCEALPWRVRLPVPGVLGLLFGATIPVGVGTEHAVKVDVANLGFDLTRTMVLTVKGGFTCAAPGEDCTSVNGVDFESTGHTTFVGPGLSQARAALTGSAYGLAKLAFGNPWIQKLQFELVEFKAGVKSTVDYAPMTAQAGDPAYHSRLALGFFAQAEAAATAKQVKNLVDVKFIDAVVAKDWAIDEVPGGAFTASAAVVEPGQPVTLRVALDDTDYLFRYVIAAVEVWRRTGPVTLERICSVPAASGQREFTCAATFAEVGPQALHAFAVVRPAEGSVSLPLELSDDARVEVMVGATPVTIPDPILEAAIRLEVRKPGGVLTTTDLLAVRGLNAEGATSLEGLQHATNLERGGFAGGTFTDLSPLSGCLGLTNLDLSHGLATDLSPLRPLVGLVLLGVEGNGVSDLEPLSGMTRLGSAYLAGNRITSLLPLRDKPALWLLYAGHNAITDLSPLAGSPLLQYLDVSSNQVVDLSVLSGKQWLYALGLSDNRISNVSALAGLPAINHIGLAHNLVQDLGPLVDNPALGAGDDLALGDNCLDLTPGGRDAQDVAALTARGVAVDTAAQKAVCAP